MVVGVKMKNLFAQSPEFLRTVNATVGASFIRDYSYAVAYWSAGDILVKDALKGIEPYKQVRILSLSVALLPSACYSGIPAVL